MSVLCVVTGLKYDEHLAEQEVDMLRMVTMKVRQGSHWWCSEELW